MVVQVIYGEYCHEMSRAFRKNNSIRAFSIIFYLMNGWETKRIHTLNSSRICDVDFI